MQAVVVTDAKYRSAIAAVRTLGRAGYRVVVTQTKGDCPVEPGAFVSRFTAERRWIDGSATDAEYPERLRSLLAEYDHPVLFCIGAATLSAVSAERERFAPLCDFLIAPPETLQSLNDKEVVHQRALELGLPVPREYHSGEELSYPVVVKPHCGEKFGLKAKDRYAIAENPADYARIMDSMRRYDPEPIVQQKVSGDGFGASLLLDRDSRLVGAVCHRRIREYPITGGPSTCCESIYDPEKIDIAYRLLSSFRFVGMAMVEFKGDCILEVNPRIWGSFPLTDCADSPFACRYARSAAGEVLDYQPQDYKIGVRMRFLLNDTAAILQSLRHGNWSAGFSGLADCFRAREALSRRDDPAPFRRYLKGTLLKR